MTEIVAKNRNEIYKNYKNIQHNVVATTNQFYLGMDFGRFFFNIINIYIYYFFKIKKIFNTT